MGIEELLDPLYKNRNPVVWLCNAMEIKGPTGSVTLSLGVCGGTRRVAFVALDSGFSGLLPLIVKDVYLDEKNCEEERRCLDFKCPRNKTCYTSWIKAHRLWRKELPRKKHFDNFIRVVKDAEEYLQKTIGDIDWTEIGTVKVFHEAPMEVKVK